MADKLDWLDEHFVLLKYNKVSEMVNNEGYKINPNVEKYLPDNDMVDKFINNLVKDKLYKDACEVLAYAIHRRAGVWWGYRSMMALIDETGGEPVIERDIADIGKPSEPNIPDFFKDMPQIEGRPLTEADFAEVNAQLEAAQKQVDELVPDYIRDKFNAYMDEFYNMFKKEHGYTPLELIDIVISKYNPNESMIDEENSPIFKAEKELKSNIEKMRQETVDLIKSVVPEKSKEHIIKMQKKALDAVYAWVVSPDEVNSKNAMDIGNECADLPAGLLCLTAFWSYGNLMPMTNQVIKTPPGLAANGLNSAILNMSLVKGGNKKPKERFEEYFNIGLNIAYGKDNWAESLECDKAPHQNTAVKNNNVTVNKRFTGDNL